MVFTKCSPVDCIYWVTPAQLTLLEDEMRIVERVNVCIVKPLLFSVLIKMTLQTEDVYMELISIDTSHMFLTVN
jgi:hypothetical protein